MLPRTSRIALVATIAVIAVAVAAFILLRDGGDDASSQVQRGCTEEERATEARLAALPTPTPAGPNLDFEAMNREAAQNSARPYFGKLCGFELVASPNEALPHLYCQGTVTATDQAHNPQPFTPSELNKSGLREQVICNGTVVATFGEVRRNYFRDTPKLHFVANREFLRYSEVDGHQVLMRLSPMPLGPVFVAAVQRWPDGHKPGILIAMMAADPRDAETRIRHALAE